MRIMSLLFFVSMFFFCGAQTKQVKLVANKDGNTLLWEVSGMGLHKPSYIFGTFHLMCKSDIQFSNQLKQALANANEMYLELDMDDPNMLLGGLMMVNMKGGKKLKDLYTDAEYEKIKSFFKDSLQMPIDFMQSMKPYFLVAMMYPKMMPCKTVSGIEEALMKIAKQQQKEIKGLETMEFQASVFDSIPYPEQAKELLKSIDSMAVYKKSFDTMVILYKAQQLDKMAALLSNSEFGMEEHQDILLDNRNKNWVAQLGNIMKKESVFVAVGTGHLAGEMGLIALLKKKKYKLRPLLNK